MLVEFIIPTYDRIDSLKCMLSSLIVQSNSNWIAHVVIDNPHDLIIKKLINDFNDFRIKYTILEHRNNDWGHTPREIGKQLSIADYIIMTGDDNYYTPNFVEELKMVYVNNPGIIYWDMIHSHYDYKYFICNPSYNQIDIGAFATRRDIAQSISLNTTFAADGEFIENVKSRYPLEKIMKINKVLYVHN